MKVQVIGFEITEGTSKKTGQPYSIGKLYAALPLAPAQGLGNAAKGYQGSEYRVDVGVLRKVEQVPVPFTADIEQQDVMRYGQRQTEIVSIVPSTATHHTKAATA